jgi:glycosyltransferase involved in cell wall biosynthesis
VTANLPSPEPVGRIRVATIVTRFMAGAGGVALRGAMALDPERYETTIFTGGGDRLLDEASAAGFEVVQLQHLMPELSPTQDRRGLQELRSRLRHRHFDVVHTHSAKAGALGRMAAAQVGVPRIVHTFHGFPFHEFQSPARRMAYVAIERRLARHTSAFLAVGSGVAAEAIRRRIAPPHLLRTIGVAVDPVPRPASRAARAEARRRLRVPPGMQVVGTVGRLDYQKAPEDFVSAISRLRRDDVYGVWIGDGPLRAAVTEQIRRLGLESRVTLLGERSDVPELLPGLDVFAMASRYEGLPCALVEAMTFGLPVVATAVNAVPDLVIAGETGLLVPPQRPDVLATALDHLLAHAERATRLGLAGRQSLRDSLGQAALGRVLDDTYRQMNWSPAGTGYVPIPEPRQVGLSSALRSRSLLLGRGAATPQGGMTR